MKCCYSSKMGIYLDEQVKRAIPSYYLLNDSETNFVFEYMSIDFGLRVTAIATKRLKKF